MLSFRKPGARHFVCSSRREHSLAHREDGEDESGRIGLRVTEWPVPGSRFQMLCVVLHSCLLEHRGLSKSFGQILPILTLRSPQTKGEATGSLVVMVGGESTTEGHFMGASDSQLKLGQQLPSACVSAGSDAMTHLIKAL